MCTYFININFLTTSSWTTLPVMPSLQKNVAIYIVSALYDLLRSGILKYKLLSHYIIICLLLTAILYGLYLVLQCNIVFATSHCIPAVEIPLHTHDPVSWQKVKLCMSPSGSIQSPNNRMDPWETLLYGIREQLWAISFSLFTGLMHTNYFNLDSKITYTEPKYT